MCIRVYKDVILIIGDSLAGKKARFRRLITNTINRSKLSLRVISFLRFNSRYNKSLKEHIKG
jgi:hypothetical protein